MQGQHTTTFAEMFTLENGGKIIDTPGIKTLSFNYLETQDVSHNFREMFEVSEDCKFSNCLHRDEPKCAVKQAIDEGRISEYRYFLYQYYDYEVGKKLKASGLYKETSAYINKLADEIIALGISVKQFRYILLKKKVFIH